MRTLPTLAAATIAAGLALAPPAPAPATADDPGFAVLYNNTITAPRQCEPAERDRAGVGPGGS